jgi:hypothetical protein
MRLRRLAVVALLALPATASAQEVVPLTGTGENVQPIARMKLPGANEIAVAGDWAFLSSTAVEETCGCLYIVNIADPAHPYLEGVWDAAKTELTAQSYGDVDISPDANLAVLTNTRGSGPAWDVIIDTSDKAHPKLLSHVDDVDGTMEYVHTSTLDGKLLYMNPQAWVGYPQPGHAAVTVVDIADPAQPKIVGKITTPGSDAGFAHDTYIDHRPDGKDLMYAASVSRTDVLDVTNPLQATWLQSTTGDYTISHEAMPNFDRTVLIVTDEGLAGGALEPAVSACAKVGTGPAAVDSGSTHFYAAAPDGTFANGGAVELGTFNTPASVGEGQCISHVIWQAPDQNRMTQAYYEHGAWVIDFSDPANAKALGYFDADNTNYWSNKAHNGYLYASNRNGTLDILRYTGEGGTKWPTTAGPAEIQLAARQGVPYVPIAHTTAPPAPPAPPARSFGRFTFTIKGKKLRGRRGRKVRLALSFTSAGKRVAVTRFKRKAGRRLKARVTGVAATGSYRWVLRAGRRKLARGRIRVGAVDGLKSTARLVARVR